MTIEYTPDLIGVLAILIQVALPLLVGLVTKLSTSSSFKAVLLLALTAVTQVLTAWYKATGAGEVFDWRTVLLNVVVWFGISVATHYGLWRPTGATAAAQNTMVTDRPAPKRAA